MSSLITHVSVDLIGLHNVAMEHKRKHGTLMSETEVTPRELLEAWHSMKHLFVDQNKDLGEMITRCLHVLNLAEVTPVG